MCLKYMYSDTNVDKCGNQRTEINHRIARASKVINVLISIQWYIHVTENRKISTYEAVRLF